MIGRIRISKVRFQPRWMRRSRPNRGALESRQETGARELLLKSRGLGVALGLVSALGLVAAGAVSVILGLGDALVQSFWGVLDSARGRSRHLLNISRSGAPDIRKTDFSNAIYPAGVCEATSPREVRAGEAQVHTADGSPWDLTLSTTSTICEYQWCRR